MGDNNGEGGEGGKLFVRLAGGRKGKVWIVGRRFGEIPLGEIKASARRQSDFQTRAERKSEETS